MKRWLLTIVLLGGCSYTFDTNAPELPYLGTPPDTASLPRLNTMPVTDDGFALGGDRRIWLVMQHVDKSYRMVPISGEPAVDTIEPDEEVVLPTWRAFYIQKKSSAAGGTGAAMTAPDMGAPATVQLLVRAAGEHPGHTFEVPAGPALIFSLGADDVFAYIVSDPSLPGYLIQRRDESFKRIVPWPKGIDPANPYKNGLFFADVPGDVFYDRDGDGRVVGHHTRDNLDVDLGIRPRFFVWADAHTIVFCGNDGVRAVNVDGVTPERVLDNDICKTQLLSVSNGYVYYDVGTTVRKVKLDGSAPPQQVFAFGENRVIGFSPVGDTFLYSTDPPDRYVHAAGDGWLGNWRFMERGTGVNMSGDRLHLHWLDHSAQLSGAGDLMAVTLPHPGVGGGTPVTLARNTRQYAFLADGRIIADENHASPGTWNRLVVVDEVRGHKQYVATGVSHFSWVPYSSDLLLDVISGASGHDVVRVKVPDIYPPPPPNQ